MDTGNKTEPQSVPPKPIGEDELEFWKQYLIERPDNKMAWYLLGKAYDREQKHGKAKYCYMQAGDVYRAFEKKAIASEEMSEALVEPIPEQPEGASRQSKKRRWPGALLLVVLFVLLATSGIQDRQADSENAAQQGLQRGTEDGGDAVEEEQTSLPEDEAMLPGAELEQSSTLYRRSWSIQMLSPAQSSEEQLRSQAAAAIGEALVDSSSGINRLYLAQGNTLAVGNRQWIQWINGMNVLVAIDKPAGSGVSQVHAYDERLCKCLPTTVSAQAAEAVQVWQRAQEELLVAMSAAEHFPQRNDSMLENAQQLTKDYPNNALPGLTDLMASQVSIFTASIEAIAREDVAREQPFMYFPYYAELPFSDKEGESSNLDNELAMIHHAEGRADSEHSWEQPLEIIVDTSAHKLAVVSGSVILRNYSVGLGGERTPLGEFEITEKVRNPNGRDDGDFGSRGMTLSNTLYAIHGTNEPESIGKDESLGCVRMGKEDVEELFDIVPIGTKVTITEGILPDQEMVPEERFRLPSEAQETNDTKVYRWL